MPTILWITVYAVIAFDALVIGSLVLYVRRRPQRLAREAQQWLRQQKAKL